ncbi:MAG: ribulose-phosphate 3-epimerase [Acidimicrobiaceae bacterium]|nr:ribulose-phosphate 3-epimerase [Acidimicrobiaceae bacterium]
MQRLIEIAPSILPADFTRLGEECLALEAAGVDRIHLDVMDGVFVPNLTFGPDIVRSLRKHLSIPFEAHLMVTQADEFAARFVEVGCSTVLVHAEACVHLHRSLSNIRSLGVRAGVVLNPHTPVNTLVHVLAQTDQILLMTVNPGFGGQAYIPLLDKIAETKALVDASGFDIDIEVDGGINATNIAECAAAGANVFVSGSALFKYADRAAGVADLRASAQSTRK